MAAARYRRPRDATGAAVHGDGAEAVLRRRAGEHLVSNTYPNTQIQPKYNPKYNIIQPTYNIRVSIVTKYFHLVKVNIGIKRSVNITQM